MNTVAKSYLSIVIKLNSGKIASFNNRHGNFWCKIRPLSSVSYILQSSPNTYRFHNSPARGSSFSVNFSTNYRRYNLKNLQPNDGKKTKEAEVDNEWENLLGSNDKQNNISSIPTVKENVFTVPNALSLSRILITPYISFLVINGQFNWALGLFVAASITDVLDGQIARIWPSQQSAVGTALDPLGDKILVTALTLSLAAADIMPMALTALIVGRDVVLVLSVFYLRYRTCPPPVTLKRYFDPTLVNAKLSPTFISKVNTAIQMAAITASMCAPVWNFTDHILLQSVYALTAATTLWSGASYIISKDTVRILKNGKT